MTTETKPEDVLRACLPNFMAEYDAKLRQLNWFENRAEQADYLEDEIEEVKAENRALRAELDAMKKDREFVV